MVDKLSHTDSLGRARMVDVGHKPQQLRIARASGFIRMQEQTVELIRQNQLKKGDVLKVAEIAGIQAAKQTPALIPLCHPIVVTQITVTTEIAGEGVEVIAECRCAGQTGVEMEALTAVSVALLTVYDMCKAVDKKMIIEGIKLDEKTRKDIK